MMWKLVTLAWPVAFNNLLIHFWKKWITSLCADQVLRLPTAAAVTIGASRKFVGAVWTSIYNPQNKASPLRGPKNPKKFRAILAEKAWSCKKQKFYLNKEYRKRKSIILSIRVLHHLRKKTLFLLKKIRKKWQKLL